MRILAILLLFLSTAHGFAQSRDVDPADLVLNVTLENIGTSPYQHEMVLLTIHGIYRRHITLEKLENPDFGGINWMQLGPDYWFESILNGVKVKNLRRQMALFPNKAGRLEIGAFVHHLTLLDENNNWFKHDIRSKPVLLEVQPVPVTADWWFPARKLEISDRWSNPPDQLGNGEGVLRVITLTAVGVGPDMLPPMPELKSPSAHIFPHPEKRFVELSPQGPVSRTLWRWTIKPRNGISAILEPIEFSYFDTVGRKLRSVTISAQRVAFAEIGNPPANPQDRKPPTILRSGLLGLVLVGALFCGLGLLFGRGREFNLEALAHWWRMLKVKQALRQSVKTADLGAMRRAARELDKFAQPSVEREKLLELLDWNIFAPVAQGFDPKSFYRNFKTTL